MNNDERNAVLLEGMYNGLTEKIDGVRETVGRELQYSVAQQAAAYDAIAEGVRQGVEAVMREIRYLSQQNSAIYDALQSDNTALVKSIVDAVNRRTDEMTVYLERKMAEQVATLRKELLEAVGTTALEARLAKRLQLQADRIVESVEDIEDRVAESLEALGKDTSVSEEIAGLRDEVLEVMNAGFVAVEERLDAQASDDVAELREELLETMNSGFIAVEERIDSLLEDADEETVEDLVDYDLLADKIAMASPEIDYDLIADKVAAALPACECSVDTNEIADKVAASVAVTDENVVAEKVLEKLPAMDYDVLAENVAYVLKHKFDFNLDEEGVNAIAEKVVALLEVEAEEGEPAEEEKLDYEALAEKVASLIVVEKEELDYDLLAGKVAEILEEKRRLSEEEAAIKAAEEAAAHPVAEEETLDYDALAEKVASLVTVEKEELNYDLIAEKVVEQLDKMWAEYDEELPEEEPVEEESIEVVVDYDAIAEKVVALLEEKGLVAAPAQEAAEEPAPVEEEPVEEPAPVEEELVEEPAPVEEELVEEPAPVEEELVEVPAPVEEEPVEEPAPEIKQEELAATEAPVVLVEEEPEVVAEPVADAENNLTTRLKRSFTAKIIESDESVKNYYSILKNAFLSYTHITSQVNWSNDRFAYNNDTVAKIGIRGKTLCVYLALDPEEFPESVYHQKFAGDTKMYERTPLMMKVKSNVALKRTLRLLELLMERLGAVKEEVESVDYAAMYAFRSEEELLAEGLIKTAIVEKSDLDF